MGLGCSPDSPASNGRFRAKQELTFALLCDEDHAVAEAYGTWSPKRILGREVLGQRRRTFVIDEDGKVAHVFAKVNPIGHADTVLRVL